MASATPAYLLGIDIGGTKIAGGIVDAATGAVRLSDRVPTLATEGGPMVLQRALALARDLIARANACGWTVAGVGVGAGGQIDGRTGVVLAATDVLPHWAGTRLKDAFADALDFAVENVAADNDASALAHGENRWGAGQRRENVIFLTLGTGVGGAIISGGRLHTSARGVSGELGHLILDPNGLPCTCGGRGCLEQYVSGPALLRHYRALSGAKPITDGAPLRAMALAEPDGPAARAIERTGELLGIGITTLVNVFGPERVIIGGGLAALGALLIEPARLVVAARALPPVRDVSIVTASLGADAGVIGAASLVAAQLD